MLLKPEGRAVKTYILLGMMGLLAACTQPVPDSGSGVGFSDFSQFEVERAQREAALRGMPAGGPDIMPPLGAVPLNAALPPAGGIATNELAAAGIGVSPIGAAPLGQTALSGEILDRNGNPMPATIGGERVGGVQASPLNAAPDLDNPGISDEQDFDAVASRESIESDAQRRAAQAAAYEQVQPTAVPERTGSTGPNIVEYALSAPNAKGQEWYSRFAIASQGRFQRNCAAYRSPDEAQRDFLARGGPERDAHGIDPDGDGFACGWDPAPFRLAVGN